MSGSENLIIEVLFSKELGIEGFLFERSIGQCQVTLEREKPEAIVKHEERTQQLIYKAALFSDFAVKSFYLSGLAF